MTIRAVKNQDAIAIITLIADCYRDYPNCYLDLVHEETGLLTPENAYDGLWVWNEGGDILASAGMKTHDGLQNEMVKFYVSPHHRRKGLGRKMLAHLKEQSGKPLFLWTDTRFTTAHQFYAANGFTKTGRIRELHDISQTKEYEYVERS